MTFCPNCGASLKPGAPACPRCGKPVAKITRPQPIRPHPIYAAYPRRPAPTNTFAILGFVMAWLPIPLAWLALSIVGLVQCGQTGQKGKGFAIAGILLRVLSIAALIAGIALLIYYADSGLYSPEGWERGDGFSFTALG